MKPSPRVLFIKSRLGFKGGLEKYTLQLIHQFLRHRCTVTVLTTFDEKAPLPTIEGAHIIPLFATKKIAIHQHIAFELATRQFCQKQSFDIIFGMERTSSQTHLRAGFGVHRDFLNRRSSIDPWYKQLATSLNPRDRLTLFLEKRAFESKKLQTLFVNSHHVKKAILAHYNTSESKIEVVANGVNWQQVQPHFDEKIKKPISSTIELLFVGHGFKRKNLDTLLKALSLLPHHNWHLSIVGSDRHENRYHKWVEKIDLKKKITFFGVQRDLLPFYERADILVLPTLYDPFANVTLEALAMGLFVITTRANGAAEFIQQSTWLLDDPLDSHSLKEVLVQLLEHWEKLGSIEKMRERRNSIRHLDFSSQLDKIVTKTLALS